MWAGDPVGQLLGRGRLGVGEAAGAERGDEQLDRPQLTRAPVDQRRPLAREVDEGLLAGAVHLPHRRPQPPRPLPVDLAELRVAVAAGMDLEVLLPEQLQRDPVALELAVDVRAVGSGSVGHWRRGRNSRASSAAIRARMDASWTAGPQLSEGANASRKSDGQEQSRPHATPRPPERAPDPGGARGFITPTKRPATQESWPQGADSGANRSPIPAETDHP